MCSKEKIWSKNMRACFFGWRCHVDLGIFLFFIYFGIWLALYENSTGSNDVSCWNLTGIVLGLYWNYKNLDFYWKILEMNWNRLESYWKFPGILLGFNDVSCWNSTGVVLEFYWFRRQLLELYWNCSGIVLKFLVEY